FEASDVEVVCAVLVRFPPGKGGPAARLWRLARRTGARYSAHKLGTLTIPSLYAAATRRAVFLDGLCRRYGVPWISVPTVKDELARTFLHRALADVVLSVSSPERIVSDLLSLSRVASFNVQWARMTRTL